MSYVKTPIHKRRFMVNVFQYKLMYGNLLYLVATVFVFFVAIFVPVMLKVGNDSLPAVERDVAGRELLVLHERLFLALPVIILLCLLHSVLISHRVAGPLHRIQQILRSMADGDLTPRMSVRRTDYLHAEAALLTETISRTAEKIDAIRESYRQARETLPRMISALGERDDRELTVLAGKLGTQLDLLGRRIDRFRISEDGDGNAPSASELLVQGQGALPAGVVAADLVSERHEA